MVEGEVACSYHSGAKNALDSEFTVVHILMHMLVLKDIRVPLSDGDR
jgi:hypothetical protein